MAGNQDNDFNRFLVPEPAVSLKLVFDNLRNYAIVGGVFALSHWVQSGAAPLAAHKFQYRLLDGAFMSWVFLALGVLSFVANLCQTNLLLLRSILSSLTRGRSGTAKLKKCVSWQDYLQRSTVWVAVVLLYVTMLVMSSQVVAHVALFAATGGGR